MSLHVIRYIIPLVDIYALVDMMDTTTIRVSRSARDKLKIMAARERVSASALIEKMVDEREKSFWEGFGEEAGKFLDSEEKKRRKVFEGALADGLKK